MSTRTSPLLAAACWLRRFVRRTTEGARAEDAPLPSWNEGATKTAILDFVSAVTRPGSPDFVPVAERIAVFDNDGTLWCEHPLYPQVVFTRDRIRTLSKDHPDWHDREPFRSILRDDLEGLLKNGEQGLLDIVALTHAGITTTEFAAMVTDWMKTARHPRFHRPYDRCIYQPMVELCDHLRANGFKTYIVSGGGVELMRPWTQRAYGIPPEQVVGSSGVVKYAIVHGRPSLLKEPEVEFVDDGPGKPVMAFGNSDGDLQMLQWTTAAAGKRFGLIVHHTDAEREYAYDRHTHVGRLDLAWEEALVKGWTIVDMKQDWKVVFLPSNDDLKR